MMRWIVPVVVLTVLASPVFPGAPLPCSVPWEWTVSNDLIVPADQLAGFSAKLGGKVTAIRNTVFALPGGLALQVNVLEGASEQDANAVWQALTKGKSPEFVILKGRLVYELVGKNDVLSQLRRLGKTLAGGGV